jgi:hypothetical protein
MLNAPVIEISAWRFQPEYYDRWNKWQVEVFVPITSKSRWVKRIERYECLKPGSKYTDSIMFRQYDDIVGLENFEKSPEWTEIFNDMKTTRENRREVVWHAAYRLIKSFNNNQTPSQPQGNNIGIDNLTVMQLEGYRLPLEKEANYEDGNL